MEYNVLLKEDNQSEAITERRIAEYFEKNGISYVYEQKAMFPRVQRRNSRYYYYDITLPDFYLPEYNVYVEYWGLVDADDDWTRTKYERNMRKKMAIYHKNNIKFISIYPRNLENLDWIFRTKFRKVTGYELPK